MKKLIFFHEKCMIVIIFVLTVVLLLLLFNNISKNRSIKNLENKFFEILWTVIPSIIILLLIVPSLELLYKVEERGGVIFEKK